MRCAETTRTSCAIPSDSRISAAPCIVSQSEDDPMMIPTKGFIAASLANLPSNWRRNAKSSRAPTGERCSKRSFSAFSSSLVRVGRSAFGYSCEQFLEPGVRFRQQPIPPTLDLLEMPNFQIVALLALGQLGKHRLRVDVAHQLADILPLPDLGSVRGQPAQVAQCDEQVFRQVQRLDFLIGKRRQLHAQFLQAKRPPACARSCCGAAPRFRRWRRFRSGSSYRPCYHWSPVESPLGIPKESFWRCRWPYPAILFASPKKTLNRSSSARWKKRALEAPRRPRRPSARIRVFRSGCDSARWRPWNTSAIAAWALRYISASARVRPARRISPWMRCGRPWPRPAASPDSRRRTRVSGLADAALDVARAQDLGSGASLERHRGPCDRDRQILRGRGARLRFAHQQLRGRFARHPSGPACLRQYPWLRRRLSDHLAHVELRGARGQRRGHAARLLVQQLARLA